MSVKYNRSTPCKKCGNTDASTEWMPAGKEFDLPRGRLFEMQEALTELMLRKCQNCGWVWTEKPLKEEEHA